MDLEYCDRASIRSAHSRMDHECALSRDPDFPVARIRSCDLGEGWPGTAVGVRDRYKVAVEEEVVVVIAVRVAATAEEAGQI